jgi:hypothetical protein
MPSLPQYAFMEWCSVKAQGQLYLLGYYLIISPSYYPSESFEVTNRIAYGLAVI